VLSYSSYSRPNCAKFNANALRVIRAQGVKTVILAARWADLQRRGLDELSGTLTALSRLGVRTILIGQTPMFTTDVQIIAFRRGAPVGNAYWAISFEPSLNAHLAALAGAGNFIDPIARLCRGSSCPYEEDGRLLFLDDGHLSAAGSLLAVDSYFPLLNRRLAPNGGQPLPVSSPSGVSLASAPVR
jgi:hypothetical protein